MLRTVTCGDIRIEDGSDLRDVLLQHALDAGFESLDYLALDNALDAVDMANHPKGDAPLDLILLANDLPGVSGIEALRDIRRSGSQVRVVLFSNDADPAMEAIELGVSGYLPVPVPRASFDRTIKRVAASVARFHGESVLLKLRDRPRRLQFKQLLYAETQGHDQVLHVVGGVEYSVRSTSQALFDQLQHDPRFFKAGSSFILNLQHVVSVGSGSGLVTLTDGSTINVPVRLRKTLETALM